MLLAMLGSGLAKGSNIEAGKQVAPALLTSSTMQHTSGTESDTST
jgi:hypothetical protein